MDLSEAIRLRKSVRKFKTNEASWRDVIECIDAARYAPTAGNNYTLKFIIVDDKNTIQKLADVAQQPFIAQAHIIVVVCTNPSRTINAYEQFGEKFCRQQAGAAIENFLLKIQEKGLATCWIGYFVENQVKKILKIPDKIIVEAMFPIGYEVKTIKQKQRLKIDLDRILYFNKYGNKKMQKNKVLEV